MFSEEMKRGILKGKNIGEKREFTEEEKKEADRKFEKILKEYGVLKENQTLEELRQPIPKEKK